MRHCWWRGSARSLRQIDRAQTQVQRLKASCALAAFAPTAVPPLLPNSCSRSARKQRLSTILWVRRCLSGGAAIPKHRHLSQDEIVLISSGNAHVWLGDQERDLHAGRLVFIPANTRISLKNIGAEPISLTFVFWSARIRGYDAMQFRAGRGNAYTNHAGTA